MALEGFSTEEWQRVDAELDRLLDLPVAEREAELLALAERDPRAATAVREILTGPESPLDRPAVEAMAELVHSSAGQGQDPALGTRIGPYVIREQLGVGGMGVVYLAERVDEHFEQRVALKIVREGARGEGVHRRFLAERQILAELEHPHIARLLDGGVSADGRPYLAMEYVEGVPLDVYCEREELDVPARLRLFLDVCAAVDLAHRNLVVHRDLKAGNILVDGEGTVKVLDFGIAKWLDEERAAQFGALTLNTPAPLTPNCSAPEQLQGGAITTATDVYALGALLFRLLSGEHPFEFGGMALTERIQLVTEKDVRLPSEVAAPARARILRGDLDRIVTKALRKTPARRYEGARELAEDVERYLEGRPVLAMPDSLRYRLGKFARRNRTAVVLSVVAVLALVGGLVAATRQARIAEHERTVAVRQEARARRISESLVQIFEDSNPYSGLGRMPTALDILDANVERLRSEFADDPELQADLMLMMARAYGGLGHTEPANQLLSDALAIRDSLFGSGSLPSAIVKLEQVSFLNRHGDAAAAQALMPDIIAAYEKYTPEDSPERSHVYQTASRVANGVGDYARADSLCQRSLELLLKTTPPDDPSVAVRYTLRAAIMGYLGRNDEALDLYDQALAIFRAHPNERHNLAVTLGNYAILLQNMGRLSAAAAAQEEAIRLNREMGLVSGDVLANHLNTYGAILNELGRYDESIPVLREAAAMNEEAGGRQGIRWLATAMTLGNALAYSGDVTEAAAWLDAGVAGMGELVGTDHLYYGVALSYRGILDRLAGRRDEAEARLTRALALLKPHLPERAQNTVSVLTELGELALAEGDLGRAEARLNEAVEIATELLPAEDSFRALAVAGLGEVSCLNGDHEQGAGQLRAAVAALTARRGADDGWARGAAERLAACAGGRK